MDETFATKVKYLNYIRYVYITYFYATILIFFRQVILILYYINFIVILIAVPIEFS